MAKIRWREQMFRLTVILLGMALLVSLICRTGASAVIDQVKTVGWGLGLVIALGGIAHLTKTLAWRCTFLCDIRNVSFVRMFGLRLVSETIGSFGLPGQVLGETARVYLLGSTLPVANSISSVTIDRGLYIVTAALVSVTGILAALFLLPLSGTWRLGRPERCAQSQQQHSSAANSLRHCPQLGSLPPRPIANANEISAIWPTPARR